MEQIIVDTEKVKEVYFNAIQQKSETEKKAKEVVDKIPDISDNLRTFVFEKVFKEYSRDTDIVINALADCIKSVEIEEEVDETDYSEQENVAMSN